MCGIVGILGKGDSTVSVLMQSLHRLEYRGYDSAGIATIKDNVLQRRRAEGKIANLEKIVHDEPLDGVAGIGIGIGHTRWATHGRASVANAHPHMSEGIAVVHNGIIENYRELAKGLLAHGATMQSETDSEIIVHLLAEACAKGLSPSEAMIEVLPLLKGTFAFVAMFSEYADSLFAACRGSPLAIGYGKADTGEIFLGSDALVLADLADEVSYLQDGDWAELHIQAGQGVSRIFDSDNNVVERLRSPAPVALIAGKGNHRHYMLKEIHEQPLIIADALAVLLDCEKRALLSPSLLPFFPQNNIAVESLRQVFLVACGTSFYASMVARYWLEEQAGLLSQADIASEFRYRHLPIEKACLHEYLGIFLSQSGETMDTLLALKHASRQHCRSLAFVNVEMSSMGRVADDVVLMHAGPEIGVAASKSFTAQLASLAVLALALGQGRGVLSESQVESYIASLIEVPSLMNRVLEQSENIHKVARDCLFGAKSTLYLGRGSLYPVALEAALKLKEISYIHAEGYAFGEMKHGPIALIDEDLPVVVFAPSGVLFDKTVSNIQEITARRGHVILVSDEVGIAAVCERTPIAASVCMPACDDFIAPIIYAVAAQLLAYYTALEKGTDIDQPRNLAKSVTVE